MDAAAMRYRVELLVGGRPVAEQTQGIVAATNAVFLAILDMITWGLITGAPRCTVIVADDVSGERSVIYKGRDISVGRELVNQIENDLSARSEADFRTEYGLDRPHHQ